MLVHGLSEGEDKGIQQQNPETQEVDPKRGLAKALHTEG
jgi:hypothetical protein